ncbi:Basic helix-loop-helix DNA-binding superfamily protein, putative isoform 2 [Hibiscus syriacus]|uniref:Basic helix-loop-helix DNA-binding superfamily protein, putative isoform 2 n=1 Tax=Hibiscus syriacus TaxID=106335 RepID=A0A6A2XYR8_HIBSY|nr:transcription factor bHLH111-like [Hibiscus syriacus]KAE8667706.1 Basic helix-loop-helix DNA-binding superfamily protein, putative isoform 2 [Hibiscus syriacus]
MAEDCTAISPPLHTWWDLHHATSLSPWTINPSSWYHHHHQNPNSQSSNCDQDDVLSISTSLTNASNHSVLTSVDESSGGGGCGTRRLVGQATVDPHPSNDQLINGEHGSDNHLWSHVLTNVGSNGADVGENLFESISLKSNSLAAGIFEPAACDYLKKIDGNWEISNSSVFNNFIKNINEGFGTSTSTDNDQQSSIESERLTKLSNMVSHWSIAPPDPHVNPPQFINPKSMENYSQSRPAAFCGMETVKNPAFLSSYQDVKMENPSVDMETPSSYLRRALRTTNNGNGYHLHNSLVNNSISMEADNFYGSMSRSPTTSNITYGKPLIDIHASSKPRFRPLNLSDCKKQGLQAANSLQTRASNGQTQGIANEGKKKRGEETSDSTTVLKKPRHENSAASSVKMHAPKVKLGDKITALQQIVSPFGKTDTASVLLEAIGYINFLQEQVQLLSNPYMKPYSLKDPWDRKDQKGDGKVDLRSRGLCLVPISCTPKVYHENTGSDYWSPTYRGFLYR